MSKKGRQVIFTTKTRSVALNVGKEIRSLCKKASVQRAVRTWENSSGKWKTVLQFASPGLAKHIFRLIDDHMKRETYEELVNDGGDYTVV